MNVDILFASPWGALLIFLLRIVDVSLDTMRMIFAIRGRRGFAAVLGFCMAIVWIFAVGNAVKHVDSILHVIGYAGGYAAGTFVGITIERLVAYGVAMVRVISAHGGVEIAHALRERGYGVTELAGHGREGRVEVLFAAVNRSHLDDVLKIVDTWDPDAFVTIDEPKDMQGGRLRTREWPVPTASLLSRLRHRG